MIVAAAKTNVELTANPRPRAATGGGGVEAPLFGLVISAVTAGA